MIPYKFREITGEFYYLVEKLTKKAQKIAQKRTIENDTKILEICGENRLEFVEKISRKF